MKRLLILIILLSFISPFHAWIVLAGEPISEKAFLQMKAGKLIAEAKLAQAECIPCRDTQRAIQEFLKELDGKGFMIDQGGNVIPKSSEKKGEQK